MKNIIKISIELIRHDEGQLKNINHWMIIKHYMAIYEKQLKNYLEGNGLLTLGNKKWWWRKKNTEKVNWIKVNKKENKNKGKNWNREQKYNRNN